MSTLQPLTAQLVGQRVAFLGKLAGMSKRDAQQLVREQGGLPLERPDASATLLVLGEHEPLPALSVVEGLAGPVREAVEAGQIEAVSETELWRRLGLVDLEHHVQRLYTPAMLAELTGVNVSVVRRWHRLGLIRPVREVRRLPYFDFQEVAAARQLAQMLASGMSAQAIRRQLAALAQRMPLAERPLAQLSVILEGSELLLRQGEGLLDAVGQYRFDFGAADALPIKTLPPAAEAEPEPDPIENSPAALMQAAIDLEDAGDLDGAIEAYRSAAAAAGPSADLCFRLAELLYRQGDLAGSRERYYVAIELDEDLVEARANLGCVLAELNDYELAVAAFQGALAFHPDYADVHYQLGRTLDDLGQSGEAEVHWRRFLELAPGSPWADEARLRLDAAAFDEEPSLWDE
jgi:tetratricopeptide (TPR) repeat protein